MPLTSFSWYQGLHFLVIGKSRILKLYLVDNTGTLPSVSPLKTHQYANKETLRKHGSTQPLNYKVEIMNSIIYL